MVYTYNPTYYSSLQDTITSLCKSILPFSLKNRRLAADQKLAKRHSDNLKWQQDSFHRILQLIALHKEGIASELDVAAFRSHLLDCLIASPPDQEPANVIRDKLIFLQELLYAKCISEEEYHCSKRPLLQRLAVQGAEIGCRDVIVGAPVSSSDEEWAVIDLRDEERPMMNDASKQRRPFMSWLAKGKETMDSTTSRGPLGPLDLNRTTKTMSVSKNSILMPESSPLVALKSEKAKRRAFKSLFHKEQQDENGEEKIKSSSKKQWNFDGLKKWKKGNYLEDDAATTPYLPSGERSDNVCELEAGKFGAITKPMMNKQMQSDDNASDFSIDKVFGDDIKKELSRIKTELSATNPNLNFSDEQMEAVSTKLPVDKAELKHFFPKLITPQSCSSASASKQEGALTWPVSFSWCRSWCERHGDDVLDVVRKEFEGHVGEMASARDAAREKHGESQKWLAFENDANMHPNLFSQDRSVNARIHSESYPSNPFYSRLTGGH